MKKTLTLYKIAMISMAVCMFAMLLGMGMIAIQKSMTLKIDFNVNPSFEIRIDYGGQTIFCNTTKGGNQIATSNYFLLSGDTLTFQNSFTSLGESFTLTIYNYTSKYVKITPSGTGVSGDSVILSKYGEEGSSDDLLFSILSGTNEIILTFEEPSVYTISNNATSGNYTLSGTSSVVENYSYTTTITANTGYELPDIIQVSVGGNVLSSGYTWEKTNTKTGTLTINSVNGAVNIICTPTPKTVVVEIYGCPATGYEIKYVLATYNLTYPESNFAHELSDAYLSGVSDYVGEVYQYSFFDIIINGYAYTAGISFSITDWDVVGNSITLGPFAHTAVPW